MQNNNKVELKYVFFGTGPLAEAAIYNLYQSGLIPAAIITKPDATIGRDHIHTAPIIKTWAESKGIQVYQPSTLKKATLESLYEKYLDKDNKENIFNKEEIENVEFYKYVKENDIDIAIVASYGKIIPQYMLDWPDHGILNIHPSMLPLYRGPSPIESQLLDGLESIGLSIMKLDAGMDSGPIYIQKELHLSSVGDAVANVDYNSETIERICGREGADMILQTLPFIIEGSLKAKDQDHSKATFCKFIEKTQGDITDLLNENINQTQPPSPDPFPKGQGSKYQILLNKWRALNPWPGLYFFIDHNGKKLRVKINKINIESPSLITEVTPEGKRPMTWESFVNGYYPHPQPLPQGEGR